MTVPLTTRQALKYSRQILLPGFDLERQERLLQSSALVVGAGGLGCASMQYLVAAGLGKLTIVDDDKIEISNLQRQILHPEQAVGQYKSESARQTLLTNNDEVKIRAINSRLDEASAGSLLSGHDIVLDCSDNLQTRNLLNRHCFACNIPLVSAAAIRMEGQISCFVPDDPHSPCYQCISNHFTEQQLSCVESGVMSPIVGIIGSLQALEAIKIVTGFGQPLVGKLLIFDAMRSDWQTFRVPKNPLCPTCSG